MADCTVLLAGGGLGTTLAVGASWFWASPGIGVDMAAMVVAVILSTATRTLRSVERGVSGLGCRGGFARRTLVRVPAPPLFLCARVIGGHKPINGIAPPDQGALPFLSCFVSFLI